ncbi:MAG: hypothetical protein AB7N71_01225 [Phycisphaerae bacterium]
MNANLPVWVTVAIFLGGVLGAIVVMSMEHLLLILLPLLLVHLIFANAIGMHVYAKDARVALVRIFVGSQFVILVVGDWVRSPYELQYIPFVTGLWTSATVAVYIFDMLIMSSAATVRWKQGLSDNRRGMRYCLYCEYDLTGNETGKCPECGEEVSF